MTKHINKQVKICVSKHINKMHTAFELQLLTLMPGGNYRQLM